MKRKSEKKSNSKRKFYPLSIILSFILAGLLAIAGYLVGASFGIFRSNIFLESAAKTGYYESVHEKFIENAMDLGKPMMLPDEVFEDIVDVDKMTSDIKQVYNSRIDKKDISVDTSSVKKKLTDNIYKYAQDNDIAIGDEQKSAIEEFVTSIEKEYKTDVDITYINYYVSFRNMYNKFFIILIVILLVLAVVDIVITIKDHHYVHRGLRYVTYATLAAAIMTGVLPLFLFIQGRYKHLNIKPVYFYNMFVDVINKSLYSFMAVSVFFILVSAGLIIATVVLRKKAEKGHN